MVMAQVHSTEIDKSLSRHISVGQMNRVPFQVEYFWSEHINKQTRV